jgi:DNA-binding NarL/FixJ family response regulator
MPELDAIQATVELTRAGSPARVLMLTTFDLDEYVYAAMKAGASGFLLKDVDPPDLVAAVRSTARGDALLSPAVTRRLIERFLARPEPDEAARRALAELTDRELDVLRLIARGPSNAEIARELFVAEPTVKTHVTRMLGKLGVRDRVQAVVFAYETGLVEPGGG